MNVDYIKPIMLGWLAGLCVAALLFVGIKQYLIPTFNVPLGIALGYGLSAVGMYMGERYAERKWNKKRKHECVNP